MTLEEFLDEWHRQANEYGASLTRDQRDIAEQAWLIATQQEREACAKLAQETVCDVHTPTGIKIYGTKAAQAIRARGNS
jgi:hypothetical protein